MINSIGLPNRGLDGFLADDLPQLGELPVPLIVSVMATGHEDFGQMIAALEERAEVAAIELNVSCPNVHSGLIVGEQPTETVALLEALRPLTSKPLIVKLTPNVADPAAVAVAAEEGGADAVSLINTMKASAIDPATGRPGIGVGQGGSRVPRCGRSPWRRFEPSRPPWRCRSSAWGASPAVGMRLRCWPRARLWSRSGRRASVIHGPEIALPQNYLSDLRRRLSLNLDSRSR